MERIPAKMAIVREIMKDMAASAPAAK